MKKYIILTVAAVVAVCFFTALAPVPETDEEIITLNGNRIHPGRTLAMPAKAIAGKHRILVFNDVVTANEREQLSRSGVRLLGYLGGGAYLVSVAEDAVLGEGGAYPAGIGIEPSMKISSVLREHGLIKRWKSSKKRILAFIASYEDEDKEAFAGLLRRSGVEIARTDLSFPHGFTVLAKWARIERLLVEDAVRVIEPPMPPGKPDHLAWVAWRSSVDQVRKRAKHFGSLTGKGITLGLWDTPPFFHSDFQDRVIYAPDNYPKYDHAHGTHTAGIILASGGEETGMAPKARLVHYTYRGDVVTEVRQAAEKYGIRITNNSWSVRAGWEAMELWPINNRKAFHLWHGNELYGFYNTAAEEYDRVVRETDVVGVFSAGNNRSIGFMGTHAHLDVDGQQTDKLFNDYHASDVHHGAITGFNLAKNVITVGATFDEDTLCDFSSTGPTDDGRLKPDIVANGYSVRSTAYIEDPDSPTEHLDSYAIRSGTSMSAPAVSGIVALLMEAYGKQFKKGMSSAVAKAVLLHGTRDLGLPGPDYYYGHGIADAAYSAETILAARKAMKKKNKTPGAFIIEDELEHREKLSFELRVPNNAKELRVTLVWHDAPGPKIINDLDVWAVSPSGKKLLPFALNPRSPDAAAKRKRNKLDNSESIRLANPEAGVWTILLQGRRVPLGPQPFALVASSGNGDRVFDDEDQTGRFDHVNAYITYGRANADSAPPIESISRGFPFAIYLEFQIAESAQFDGYSGPVIIEFSICSAAGKEFMHFSSRSTLHEVGVNYKILVDGFAIPNDLPTGNYYLEVINRMFNGKVAIARHDFTIN